MINVWGCLTKNIAGSPFLFTQAIYLFILSHGSHITVVPVFDRFF